MENRQLFPAHFGELLKFYRKRQQMTQKQLAQSLGVHTNTISSWELGTYLPATRGLVLELARYLSLDELETRHLLESSLTALSPRWQIPIPRNPFFTGREEVLEALHTHLRVQKAASPAQAYALYGLGGIGKTQVALEYAYRHGLEHSAVFWIEAETRETILASMQGIAELLQLPARQETDYFHIVAGIRRWLNTQSGWLLIWDNLEDLDLLQHLLPVIQRGGVLITTRCQALGTLACGLELRPMEREEGKLFLFRRAKVLKRDATKEQVRQLATRIPAEYAATEELVKAMDGLPLALDQAGAYIEETGCSFSNYLRRYERQRRQLLARRGAFDGHHPHSVASTFRLACQRAAQRNPAALELLRFCAFLYPDAIPEELLLEGVSYLGTILGPVAADPYRQDQAIAALRSLSLIQRHAEAQMLSFNRLVQVVLQEEMSAQEQAIWRKRAIVVLNKIFPDVTHTTWKQCERLLPHALTCTATIPNNAEDQDLADLLQKASAYLRERAYYQRAPHIGEQAPGSSPMVSAIQVGAGTEKGEFSEHRAQEAPEHFRNERLAKKAPGALQEVAAPSFAEARLFQEFLDACCELHPCAWSRTSDLWEGFEHWARERQERFLPSRRAFSTYLKTQGCRADRTNTARIWRGVALATKNRDQR